MLNGGIPSSWWNNNSGRGESECSVSLLNSMFCFCSTECEEAYTHYFSAMQNTPVKLLGMDGTYDPSTLSIDRSPAILNAGVSVWPNIRVIVCWPHVSLYVSKGRFRRYMSDDCSTTTMKQIEDDIKALHEACGDEAFDFLFQCMAVVGKGEGQATFAKYFKQFYVSGAWGRWHYSASKESGRPCNQNSIESDHSAQKKMLAGDLLKAPPLIVCKKLIPMLLQFEGQRNADPKKWPAGREVS